jgi:LysR family glycine cleavage system transcriptional activator
MDDPDWRKFPSLSSLRAFEAAARLGGFSAAARALNVTHAAVAQQVRALEAETGAALIQRAGRGMALTPEGAQLAEALTEGFAGIQAAVRQLRRRRDGDPVTVTMTPTFAVQWMMPRLWQFWEAWPDIGVSLRPDQRVLDLRREGIDLAIRFGNGDWPGMKCSFLTSARYVVVAEPSLLGDTPNPTKAEMQALPWVFEENWPEGLSWLKGQGIDPARIEITTMPGEEMALTAARQGYGLVVASAALVEEDVAEGRLRILIDPREDRPAYFVVTPPGPVRPAAQTFIDWLKGSV